MKRHVLVRLLLTILVALTACGRPSPQKIATGFVRDGKYINNTVPIELSIPKDWHVFTPDENQQLKERGVADAASRVDAPKSTLQKAVSRVTQLITLSRQVPVTQLQGNSSFACFLEDVEGRKQRITDGHSYLTALLDSLRTVNSPLAPIGGIQTKTISGQEFSFVTLEMSIGPQRIVQRYYARYQQGFILALIVTGEDVDGDPDLGSILRTMKLTPNQAL